MVKTQGLKHINLLVSDVHPANAFYQRVFGLEELFWEGPGMVFLRPPGSHDTITLHRALTRPLGPATSTISVSVWPTGANWTGH